MHLESEVQEKKGTEHPNEELAKSKGRKCVGERVRERVRERKKVRAREWS